MCGKDKSLNDIFINTMKVHHMRMYNLFKEIGVHPGQQFLLNVLNQRDGQIQKDLAKNLKIKPATVTVIIQRAEKNGFVRREQDKNDQRVLRVFITEKGKEMCKKADIMWAQLEEDTFENLTMEEKIILRRLLMQMYSNLSSKVDEDNCEFPHNDL